MVSFVPFNFLTEMATAYFTGKTFYVMLLGTTYTAAKSQSHDFRNDLTAYTAAVAAVVDVFSVLSIVSLVLRIDVPLSLISTVKIDPLVCAVVSEARTAVNVKA